MVTTRDCVREYLIAGTFNTVTGYNNRSIQYQGFVDKKMVFGLYNEDGDHDGETTDLEAALDYIGLERDCSYNPVYQAYKALVECPEGEEAMVHCGIYGYGVNIENLTWKKVKDVPPDRIEKFFGSMSNCYKEMFRINEDSFAKDVNDRRDMSLIDFIQEFLDEQDAFYSILGYGVFDYATAESNRYIMLFPSFGWQRVDNFKSETEARFYLWNTLAPYLDMSKDDFCSKFDYIDDYYFG